MVVVVEIAGDEIFWRGAAFLQLLNATALYFFDDDMKHTGNYIQP